MIYWCLDFAWCASTCVTELDVLTGEIDILRCDLVMDGGVPLNPAIDIGQVEGGFIMVILVFVVPELLFPSPPQAIPLSVTTLIAFFNLTSI